MLEGLESINWSMLHHAYGEATDVPDMLRAMASPDPGVRHQAYDDAYGNIFHQGSVYSATAASVPFLYELAQAPLAPDRHDALFLLYKLLQATERSDTQATPAVRAAVIDGLPVLKALLFDFKPIVRRHAACLMSCFVEHQNELQGVLRTVLENDLDPETRATALYAIGRLEGRRSTELYKCYLEDPDPLLRFVAVRLIAALAPKTDAELLNRVLLDFITRAGLMAYRELPHGGDLLDELDELLEKLGPAAHPEITAYRSRLLEDRRADVQKRLKAFGFKIVRDPEPDLPDR